MHVAVDDRMEAGPAVGTLIHGSDSAVFDGFPGVPLTRLPRGCYCFGRMAAGWA
jgi:hypothetical protein